MRDIDLRAGLPTIERLARAHARLLNATDEEIAAATQTVTAALQHPLLLRAQQASSTYRELPISTKDPAGNLIEGVIDLAFVEGTQWTVIDFKTDAEDTGRLDQYRQQVGWYVYSIERVVGSTPQSAILLL
jgi:ATP-dependent exoDNAse (exonuclease V) beta subunit